MPALNLPYNIQNGDGLDADKVMANLETITAGFNGNIGTDNAIIDSPVAQPGAASSAGVSNAFLRSDVLFAIQGFEQVTTLPTTGNFLYRRCVVTAGVNLGKGFICTSTAGTGTWVVVENPAATDLVIHAAQHADAGHDPLPDVFLTDHMKAARAITQATLGADVTSISTTVFTTILDLVLPASMLLQTVQVIVTVRADCTSAVNSPTVGLRVQDTTVGGTPTIWRSSGHRLGPTGGVGTFANLCYSFYYTMPTTGARTLRLQAGCTATNVDIKAPAAFNGDSTAVAPTLQAVIV